ncbi:MAG: hypothetical protein WBH99_06635 [Azovibrio sp.]
MGAYLLCGCPKLAATASVAPEAAGAFVYASAVFVWLFLEGV